MTSEVTSPIDSGMIRIDAREAQRLKERFLTRSQAVFYARLAFWILGVGILAYGPWRSAFGVESNLAWAVIGFCVTYTIAAQLMAGHVIHGRWVMFLTLNLDLVLLGYVVFQTGGLESPVMAATLLFTIFFALLFPNPVAIVPPLLLLPVVVRLSQLLPDRSPFAVELLWLLLFAALNGVAVYVIVYLTGREEKQQREILELEKGLKKMAVVEERSRLARDIHDGIGAALSGLIIQSEYMMTLARGDENMQGEIRELKSAAEEAIDEVRRALTMMRDEFELVPQLENTGTTFTNRHRIPVELTIEGEPPNLSDEQQLTIFRIMQECLTNIAKHAEPTKVVIDVHFEAEGMRMSIVDDGKGFDTSKSPKHHYGLINIRERAKKAAGEVDIQSAPGEGTTITLEIHRLLGRPAAPTLAASAGALAEAQGSAGA
jgi:signal transduction histidine kinase